MTLNGTPAIGSFSANTANCVGLEGPVPTFGTSCSVSPDALAISATVGRGTLSFSQPAGLISVQNTASSQTLTLTAGFTFTAFQATLVLSGPANAFIDGTDFRTLHPGPVDPGASLLLLNARSSFSGAVQLTSVSLDSVPVPVSVPEPAGWTVLAAGLLVGAGGVRLGRFAGRPAAAKG